jgi:uncharacterized protein YbaR (Trm112 family)
MSDMRPEVLAILRCPEDRSPLSLATSEVVEQTNAVIRAGRLQNRAGRAVEQTIDGGLVRASGDVLYPIVDGIPVLLADEAIELTKS